MMEYLVGSKVNGKFVVLFTTNNVRMAMIKRRKLEASEKKSMEIKKRA